MRIRLRVVYTGAAGLLLLLLYFMIFSFSAQDGEKSGGLSLMISQLGVELWNNLTRQNWSEHFMEELAAYFENPIRKLAHFAEYAVMGFLIHSFWACWERCGKKWVLFTLIWVFLSAAADELHQRFVPGRSGNFPDVLLDTGGGLAGVLFCMLVFRWIHSRSSGWRAHRK